MILPSCTKESESVLYPRPATPYEMIHGSWQLEAVTINPAHNVGGEWITDWYSQLGCRKDDWETIMSPGGWFGFASYTLHKCGTTGTGLRGMWHFNADSTLTITGDIEEEWKIDSLTISDMVRSKDTILFGVNHRYTATYKKI